MKPLAQGTLESAKEISWRHPGVRYQAFERTALMQRTRNSVVLSRADLAAGPLHNRRGLSRSETNQKFSRSRSSPPTIFSCC